jgi:hypothetical protein
MRCSPVVPSSRPHGGPEEDPPSTEPAPKYACPRCGGATAPRRQTRRSNPFLQAPSDKQPLTCVDCGLDFDVAI